MASDQEWYEYKCKSGETVFYHNTETGEYRWAGKYPQSTENSSGTTRRHFHAENSVTSTDKAFHVPLEETVDAAINASAETLDSINGGTIADSVPVNISCEWLPWKCKSGETLYYYNKVTGERRWEISTDMSRESGMSQQQTESVQSVDREGDNGESARRSAIQEDFSPHKRTVVELPDESTETGTLPITTGNMGRMGIAGVKGQSETSTPSPASSNVHAPLNDLRPGHDNFQPGVSLEEGIHNDVIPVRRHCSLKNRGIVEDSVPRKFVEGKGLEEEVDALSSDEDSDCESIISSSDNCSNFSDDLPSIPDSDSMSDSEEDMPLVQNTDYHLQTVRLNASSTSNSSVPSSYHVTSNTHVINTPGNGLQTSVDQTTGNGNLGRGSSSMAARRLAQPMLVSTVSNSCTQPVVIYEKVPVVLGAKQECRSIMQESNSNIDMFSQDTSSNPPVSDMLIKSPVNSSEAGVFAPAKRCIAVAKANISENERQAPVPMPTSATFTQKCVQSQGTTQFYQLDSDANLDEEPMICSSSSQLEETAVNIPQTELPCGANRVSSSSYHDPTSVLVEKGIGSSGGTDLGPVDYCRESTDISDPSRQVHSLGDITGSEMEHDVIPAYEKPNREERSTSVSIILKNTDPNPNLISVNVQSNQNKEPLQEGPNPSQQNDARRIAQQGEEAASRFPGSTTGKDSDQCFNFLYLCYSCGKSFNIHSHLALHISESHSDEKPIYCANCHVHFDSDDSLSAHLQTHASNFLHECKHCGVVKQSRSDLIVHLERHTKEKRYTCVICGRTTKRCVAFRNHVQHAHRNIQPIKCSLCEVSFLEIFSLDIHMQVHKDRYKCTNPNLGAVNGQINQNKGQLQEEANPSQQNDSRRIAQQGDEDANQVASRVQGSKAGNESDQCFKFLYLCYSCGNSFSTHSHLASHISESHSDEKPIYCANCHVHFDSDDSLSAHLQTHASNFLHECKHCGVVKQSRSDLIVHLETHTKEKRYTCVICGRTAKRCVAFKNHIQHAHRDIQPIKCSLCEESFLEIFSLDIHMKVHKDRYKCTVCGLTGFRHHNLYARHEAIHRGAKPYKCTHCDQAFKFQRKLARHTQSHLELATYSCDHCDKRFFEKHRYVEHVRIHTGERPLECETCGKRFRTRTHLNNHCKIHLQSKCYKCETCGKSFAQVCSLIRHRRTHTGEKKHHCPECKKTFTQSCSLARHLRIHTGNKFNCPKCPRTFLESWCLKNHLKLKH